MNSKKSKQKYTSFEDFLEDNDTAHIDSKNIESIYYDHEDTGNIADLTTYIHGSVLKILSEIDERIKKAISPSLSPSMN